MNGLYIIYHCPRCGNEFIVFEVIPSNCPYCRDRGINKINRYSNIKECMQHDSFKRVSGRVKIKRK